MVRSNWTDMGSAAPLRPGKLAENRRCQTTFGGGSGLSIIDTIR